MHNEHTPMRYLDTATIFIEAGVATTSQVSECLKKAILDAEKILGYNTNCKFIVNLIVNNEGKYFGIGYIRVSNPQIYWMLLGRNPDGTERIEEYPDPDWNPPPNPNEGLSLEEVLEKNKKKTWSEIAEEEERFIQPKIKRVLLPLITIPGFKYDKEQINHLEDLAKEKGEPDIEIPEIGCFEISRAYVIEPETGMMKNRLCARNVPNWIPEVAFKTIFSPYVSEESRNKKGTIYIGNKEYTDTYPIVNFIDTNKGSRIVFVTFDPSTKDALFSLLMTKKTRIINPRNPDLKTTLVFMHAYENQNQKQKR